jgi:PAS domain-containing protein
VRTNASFGKSRMQYRRRVVVQDPSGVAIYANQAALDYTGLTADDVFAPIFEKESFIRRTWKDFATTERLPSRGVFRSNSSIEHSGRTVNIAGI